MLTLIGLGLHDEKDLTLRGIEEARNADEVYVELYTGYWHGDLKKLSELIGKEIVQLERKDLEENSQKILNEAKEKRVAIFVQGDPLVATTHSSLLIDAKKFGIETKIIHNASIISAIAETGLHIYKFGPTVTIPFLEKTKGVLPESVYQTIKENKYRGLHTLCLLDISDGEPMKVNEGLEILLKMEDKFGKILDEKIIIFCNAGGNSKIFFSKVSEIVNKSLEDFPAVLIIPGNLHFTEKEFLERFSK